MTGEVPYYRYTNVLEAAMVRDILEKKLPEKPDEMSDGLRLLWNICMRCWTHVAEDRATIQEVSSELSQINLTIRERAKFKTRKAKSKPLALRSALPEGSSSGTIGSANTNEREVKPKQPQTTLDEHTIPPLTTKAETNVYIWTDAPTPSGIRYSGGPVPRR